MNKIRLTESELRRIVKESVKLVLDEAYNNTQYANLAGQASGALDSFGGKVKGFFNPKWKQRKERQLRNFAKASTAYRKPYIMKNDKYGDGAASYNKQNKRYDRDYFTNTYTKDENNPYQIRRIQYDDLGFGHYNRGMSDGEYYEPSEMRDIDNNQYEPNDDNAKVRLANLHLNNAFRTGRNAAIGKTKKSETNSGGVRLDGTGTNNGMFKHTGKGNY